MKKIQYILGILLGIWLNLAGCQELDEAYNATTAAVTDFSYAVETGTVKVSFVLRTSKGVKAENIRLSCEQHEYISEVSDGHYTVNMQNLPLVSWDENLTYNIAIKAVIDGEDKTIYEDILNFEENNIRENMPSAIFEVSSEKGNPNLYIKGELTTTVFPLIDVGVFYASEKVLGNSYSPHEVAVKSTCKSMELSNGTFAFWIEGLDWNTDYVVGVYLTSVQGTVFIGSERYNTGIPFFITILDTDNDISSYTATCPFSLKCYDSTVSDIKINAYAQSGMSTGNLSQQYWGNFSINPEQTTGRMSFSGLSPKTSYRWDFTTIAWTDSNGNQIANINRYADVSDFMKTHFTTK